MYEVELEEGTVEPDQELLSSDVTAFQADSAVNARITTGGGSYLEALRYRISAGLECSRGREEGSGSFCRVGNASGGAASPER
ncbi:hypothetical protein ABIE37_000100 [Arthrobacter bambusae]|uniref:Uncharacterized protein n=1 Tax=Arthrobacter bambusae TaxID=1338426 RepID=A0ABV2P0R0_9MICC